MTINLEPPCTLTVSAAQCRIKSFSKTTFIQISLLEMLSFFRAFLRKIYKRNKGLTKPHVVVWMAVNQSHKWRNLLPYTKCGFALLEGQSTLPQKLGTCNLGQQHLKTNSEILNSFLGQKWKIILSKCSSTSLKCTHSKEVLPKLYSDKCTTKWLQLHDGQIIGQHSW